MANGDKTEMVMWACEDDATNQIFSYTKKKEIANYKLCMDGERSDGVVKTWQCHGSLGNQLWEYDEEVW